MRADLNLASHPFGRSRLFWIGAGASAVVLTVLCIALAVSFFRLQSSPDGLQVKIQQARAELARISSEHARLNAALQSEQTIEVFDRSDFLNQLLLRKGISWTKTFADIEQALPPRVLIMQIRPAVTPDNQVELEMQAGAETPQDFIEFIQQLENSTVFGPPEVRGYAPPNDNDPYYRYQLRVSYEQKL